MNTVTRMSFEPEDWPISGSFVISRGARTIAKVIKLTLESGGFSGVGECVPYARYNETIESVSEQLAAVKEVIETGVNSEVLQKLMPAGAARNALDCALWDLEAKKSGKPVWQLAGMEKPHNLTTAFTISLGTPEKMAQDCLEALDMRLLKVKLGGDGDIERMIAVREAVPHAELILDANEAWTGSTLEIYMATAQSIGAALIEQPLPANADAMLENLTRLVPVCADESLHTRNELATLRRRYDCINIKLDKSGGLTEALALKQDALAQGFKIMVGCMVSTSLSMAPAFLLAQGADFVDLDGPLLLAKDRILPIPYDKSTIMPPPRALWG